MAASALIICERTGHWASALRRVLGNDVSLIRETRRKVDCWQELSTAPTSIVVLEWSGDRRSEHADFVDRLGRGFPQARCVVVADCCAAADEWLAREAGAIHFVTSPRLLRPVASLLRKHLSGIVPMDVDTTDQLWQLLPWNSD